MKRMVLSVALALVTVALVGNIACAEQSSLRFDFDFRDGGQGWEAGFAEYSPEMQDMMLDAGVKPLPPELGTNGTGYYLQGMNRSDDLFMFLKRRLGTDHGVVPGQEYRVFFTIVFASNAPTGAVGIGGSPGESVFLKAGASMVEPDVYLDSDTGYYVMNVDKGPGNSGDGPAASVIGHIANGLSPEQNPRYVSVKRQGEHKYTVTASPDGELWLLVGTDSGFEGLTAIYYQRIAITLTPVR